MLQKSVWREAATLRSAEVDAVLNPTVSVPQSGAKRHEKAEETIQFPVSLAMDAWWYSLYQREQFYPSQTESWISSS